MQNEPSRGLDGVSQDESKPFVPQRTTALIDMERAQSGGLDDDPTDSGMPVKNRRSYANLKGGR